MNEDKFGYSCKGYGCFVMLVSAVAIIFSIAALLRHDNWDCEISPAGFVIATLSALITFVVAWQIWQVIDTKQTVENVKQAAEKIQELEKEIEITKNMHKPFLAYNEGVRYFDAQKYSSAFHYFCAMAEMYADYEIECNNFLTEAIDNAIKCVEKEPWSYKHRMFIDRIDGVITRLRSKCGAVTNLELRLRSLRKVLVPLCEENIPDPNPQMSED